MNILVIGPYAPHGQVGAIRVTSLTRSLVNAGHVVTVLCLSRDSLLQLAPNELCAEVPTGVRVVNYDITMKGRNLFVKSRKQTREFREKLMLLLGQQEFDVAFLSGGPFYTFPAANDLKRHGIPYIVDYRDLNVSSKQRHPKGFNFKTFKYWITFPLRLRTEWSCVRNASFVCAVHPRMKENLQSFFKLDKDKVFVAFNGFDESQIEDDAKYIEKGHSDNGVVTIGYFGKLMYYNKDFTKDTFEAIANLRKQGYDVRLLHVGPESELVSGLVKENTYGLQAWYTCSGLKPYGEGVGTLSSCDMFYLEYIADEGPGTKIFDYIYLDKPVVARIKRGIALDEFLETFTGSHVCYSAADTQEAIREIIDGGETNLLSSEEARASFSREAQNKVIISRLESLA